MRAYRNGFTRLEFCIALAVIALVAGVLLDRLLYLQQMAEATAMRRIELELVSMLRIRQAVLMAEGKDLTRLLAENPFTWFDQPPAGYGGECRQGAQPGQWCFDAPRREIVYRPARRALRGATADEIRWRVERMMNEKGGMIPTYFGVRLLHSYDLNIYKREGGWVR